GLVVLTPLAIEARAVRTGLPRARIVRGGMGRAKATRAAASLELGSSRALAIAGFCGALDPTLRPGDIVVATELRGPDGTRKLASSSMLQAALSGLGIRARTGPIVSVDHLVSGNERLALADTGALAVDMESAWLAA